MERIVQEYLAKPNLGFQFTQEMRGETAVFHCRGAFSLGSYRDLSSVGKEILKTPARRIVLDMREVEHMDSTGIGTLATIFKDAQASARQVVLVPSEPVRNSLTIANIHRVFRFYESVEDALRAS